MWVYHLRQTTWKWAAKCLMVSKVSCKCIFNLIRVHELYGTVINCKWKRISPISENKRIVLDCKQANRMLIPNRNFLSSFKCWILNMRWIRNNQIPSKLNVYYPNRLHFCLFEIQKVTNQTIKYYILNGCIATSSKQYFLFDVDLREKCSKNLISQWSRDLNSNITQREICCVANWIRCQNSIEEFQLRHRRFYYEIVLQRNGWQKKTGAFMI